MKRTPYRVKLFRIRKSIRAIQIRTAENKAGGPKRPHDIRNPSRRRTVRAPVKFQVLVAKHREELFEFFSNVEASLAAGDSVRLDFRQVKELHPCGTLVFMCRLDVWLGLYKGRLSCNYPEDDVVEQLFQHVTVLARLGMPPRKQVTHDRVSFWHFHSGSKADPSAYRELTSSVVEKIEHPAQVMFADCLNEAVCNTVGHAYRFLSGNSIPKSYHKWWIFSQFKEGRMFVAIYDAGVGIPKSLRRKPEWIEYLRARHYKDGRIIESAIASNRTSTKQPERGKGLPEMLEFSKLLHAGGLSIWSGKGGYEYDPEFNKGRRRKFKVPLPGTLVLWEIPFREEHDDENDDDLHS